MGKSTRRLVESAVMIAIGTVLSMFPFSAPWAFGGGVTICSMLPLVIIAHRYGTKWGLFTAFVYSVLQLILGVSNVQFAAGYGFVLAVGVLLLDYILAFTVIGLSACFNGVIKNHLVSIVVGIVFTFALRFVCHFLSGWIIWGVITPNEMGLVAPLYSLIYNGGYMLPETIITAVVAALTYKPLERYWLAEDLAK
ncbi:MAG TPA: energy-coupled thiamine transporter ThiT [Candidatus Ornithocaccomicrobium faecavium]|uniref:Energy-coupled thiamine transporter ThiT n=1 Tax=Candidatus Ornithocaccomicrobium faecavium TaxID=2840890 RepID=A0A9D1TD87_9FIRM|nr:energy-coupled thiamine transporter ThiT [Candidatus Ornithocaccomicrobium faecavium]